MSDFRDAATGSIKIATDVLFVRNPVGTSMGTVFGVLLHGLSELFSPFLNTIGLIKISSITVFHFIALGVFGFNVKHLYNAKNVSSEIEGTIRFIEQQVKKGNLTKVDAKQKYRELVSKAVENARFDNEVGEAVKSAGAFSDRSRG